jgi:hypothetical protein
MNTRFLSVRRRPWLLAAGFGTSLGVGAHYALGPASVLVATNVAHAESTAAKHAAQLLGCYATRATQLGDAVKGFRGAKLSNLDELHAAGRPLVTGIIGMNDAFVELSKARFALTVELRRSLVHSPEREALLCDLAFVQDFQWNTFRPLLNGLTGNIIRVWRHQDLSDSPTGRAVQDRLKTIRQEQAEDWSELEELIRTEAGRLLATYRGGCSTSDLAPKR